LSEREDAEVEATRPHENEPHQTAPTGVGPPFPILFRQDDVYVIGKPARWACHKSRMVREGPFLLQPLRKQLRARIYLVHRLDRATSGCLLVTTNREKVYPLQRALADPQTTKTYVTLVRGFFASDEPVVVNTPIKAEKGTKEAESLVRCIGRSHEPRCSLLVVTPKTGRHHQVRRHVRDLNHPVLCDKQHGDHRENKVWKGRGLTRLALHCLSLDLWLEGEHILRATCPLAADLTEVFGQLPWWQEAVERLPELAEEPTRV
jgi:tRNA pseudouridine65 synthase